MYDTSYLRSLYHRYGVITNGFERRYNSDPFERDFDLEGSTPYELVFVIPDKWKKNNDELKDIFAHKIEGRSWTRLLENTIQHLQKVSPKTDEELLSFKTEWSSDFSYFSVGVTTVNHCKVNDNVYLTTGHTAIHSKWLLGDLLKFYGVSKANIILHKAMNAEPKELIEELEKYRTYDFKEFLRYRYGFNNTKSDQLLKSLKTISGLVHKTLNCSVNNLLLIDSTSLFSNLKSNFLKRVTTYGSMTEKQIEVTKRCLDYLSNYLIFLYKDTLHNKEEFDVIPTRLYDN